MALFILANALMLYAVYRLVWLDQGNYTRSPKC